MKTPREILLDRHRKAEARLDAIRERILATELPVEADSRSLPLNHSFSLAVAGMKLWRELILPCRRIWCGLAAVWLVIAVMNIASKDSPKIANRRRTSPPNSEILMATREQRLLRQELLGSSIIPAAPPGVIPPRSERRERVLFA